jgi:hypothetical protein
MRESILARYHSVEEARTMAGLRLVVTAYVPGLWSEAAKSIFDAKGLGYTLVEQTVGGENAALQAWTAQTSGPVAVWENERPRSTWIEQLYLAERLAPEPRLIPERLEDRLLMFGLCNELAGENGFGWNLRMRVTHATLLSDDVDEFSRALAPKLAAKYGYDAGLIDSANAQMVGVVEALRDQLHAQQSRGVSFLIGDRLSALDIYWATFAGAIEPLCPELCPNMPEPMRVNYTDPKLKAIGGDALFAHRDRIYRDYLKLPMNF